MKNLDGLLVGVAMLALMGRKGAISQENDAVIEVVDDEEEVADEELESVQSFIRLLNQRRTRKGVTNRDKLVLARIIALVNGPSNLSDPDTYPSTSLP